MPNPKEHAHYENLILDPQNPRLPESVERDRDSILRYIADSTSIEGLVSAIAQNDYFPGEPLVTIADPENDGKFIVVEGNRRLSAVLILNGEYHIQNKKIEEIVASATYKPDILPIIICPNRESVLPYLGFRHITGVKPWEPLAKARYMLQIFNTTSEEDNVSERYYQVAQKIASRRDNIKRNLDTLAVYRHIEDEGFYGIDDLGEETIKFAVLSTALADERIAEFTGTAIRDDEEVVPTHPIVDNSKINPDNLEELIRWIYEPIDEEGNTRVGESRNLRKLAAVVANENALSAFRHGASLDTAFEKTKDIKDDFLSLLYSADDAMSDSAGMVANVDYDETSMKLSRRILKNTRLVGNALKEKQGDADDEF